MKTRLLLDGLTFFAFQHFFLRASRAAPLLSANFLDLLSPFTFFPQHPFFQLFDEQASGQETVHRLAAAGLAAHGKSAGPVPQQHDDGSFVDLLAARSAAADELLLEVRLEDAKLRHPSFQVLLFGFVDRAGDHPLLYKLYTQLSDAFFQILPLSLKAEP